MFETETDETETGALVCDVCGSDVPLTMQLALIDGANVCESCLSETDEIMDDDWTTDDGNRFYQNGKLILDASDMTDKQAARAAALVMKKQQFWPNIWFISDHGNVHPFTF